MAPVCWLVPVTFKPPPPAWVLLLTTCTRLAAADEFDRLEVVPANSMLAVGATVTDTPVPTVAAAPLLVNFTLPPLKVRPTPSANVEGPPTRTVPLPVPLAARFTVAPPLNVPELKSNS